MNYLLLVLFSSSALCLDDDVPILPFIDTTGSKYITSSYKSSFKIQNNRFSYQASEEQASRPATNIFDGNTRTFWAAFSENNETFKNHINVTFTRSVYLDAIVLYPPYRTSGQTREFDGLPLRFNIYSSENEEPLKLKAVFTGEKPTAKYESFLYQFEKPFKCKYLKMEYDNITADGSFNGRRRVAAVADFDLFEGPIAEQVQFQGVEGNYSDSNYVNDRVIPSSKFTCRSTGENPQYPLSNAFDDKTDTYFIFKDPNTDIFKNYLTFTFTQSLKIEAILMDTSYSTRGETRTFSGFPISMTLYASSGEEGFKPLYSFTGNPVYPHTRFQFVPPKPIECDKLRIEFSDVTNEIFFSNNQKCGCLANLYLLQALDDDYFQINEEINDLFNDYAQFELKEGIDSAKINELRERATNFIVYENSLKPLLDRAEAVLKGSIKKDPHREFSTKPGSKHLITQYGDIAGHCRYDLKFNSFGTNRQVIGIGGTGNRPIICYVDVEPLEGFPKSAVRLPTLTFCQSSGTWQCSFIGAQLHLGRNAFKFPDFMALDSYRGANLVAGGPIHVSNPYTLEEQKGHVTLYFEQGYLYPAFRSGDDEETFRMILTDYYNRLNDPNDTEITVTAFEAFSNHVITSAKTQLAYNTYINNGISPQSNVDRWDDFLGILLDFAGVPFDKNDPKYHPLNDYVRQNFRDVQPYAGFFAFASGEMIGLPMEGTHGHLVYLSVPGWAIAHEFGHTVDKKGRIWGENTNNMWALLNLFRIEKRVYDRVAISSVSQHLSSDFSPYVTHEGGLVEMAAIPSVWWIIEGGCPGYWSTSENLFVYERSDIDENNNSILCITERFIYYASLAIQKNLSCYFERFGFWFPGEHRFNSAQDYWNYQNSTDDFRRLMNKALQENRIVDECPKYWYVNLDHYNVLNRHDSKLGEWSTCYSQDDIIYPISITKYDTYYFLTLPEIKDTEAHLCYEIQSFIDNKWQVVGSSYNTFFQDDYPYDNDFTPKYRIIGYDRSFHTSGIPPERDEEIQTTENIFRIDTTYFSSLQDAINAIQTDIDIIYVMKSTISSPVVLNRTTIKIMPDPELTEPVTIMKLSGGNLFTNKGCNNLQIGSDDTVQLIFDGNNFKNNGNIISSGINRMNFYNCIIKNSVNTEGDGKGGAIYVSYGTTCCLYNTIIEKCSGKQGGAIHLQGGGWASVQLYNTTIRNCFASNEGGAIYGSTYQGWCQIMIRQNSIIENNEASNYGGAIYFMIKCTIYNSFIRNNKAGKEGGAVYFKYDNYNEQLQIEHTVVENDDGKSAIYLTPRTHLTMNDCSISGIIYKTELAQISLHKNDGAQILPDFTKTTFSLDLPNGGAILISNIENFAVGDSISDIHVLNGYAQLNGTTIVAYPNKCTITVNFNRQQITKEFSHGIFTFSNTFEGIGEDYYITSWSSGDTTYNIGDQILINKDMEFTINALMYYKVTLNYGSQTQVIRVTQNYIYYMPMTTPDGERLFGFNCVTNGQYYAYAEPVEIVSDMTFNAVIVQMHTLTIIVGSETTTLSKKYGDEYTLTQPPDEYDGKTFKYWLIDDVQHQPGDVITVNADMTITAFYSDTITITFIIGEKEHSAEYRHNDEIVLHYPGPELVVIDDEEEETGRDFDYWLIDGQAYLLYSTYIVTKNVEIVAHYTQINRDQKITVSFQIPRVNSNHFADGTKTVTQSFDYLSNMSFPEGESLGDFGFDSETEREIIFSYWNFNGQRFNALDTVGVTTAFTVVAATELSENVIPTATPMATLTQSPTPSDLPPPTPSDLPPATPLPTDPKIEADIIDYIELDNNKAQINFDCSVIQGYIKVFLNCETCTKVNSGIWFTTYFEDYQVSRTEFDDRKITVQNGNEVDVSSFISDIQIDHVNNAMTFNKGTSMLKLTSSSEYLLKCYVPPSATPMETPVPPDQTPIPPEPTPAQTPFVVKDLSHSKHTGEIDDIILDDEYPYTEIIDAQFTECTLKHGGDYLITVQKPIKFKDVDFTNLQIGAIKIDSNDVVIENCKFIECSSNTENGNAIYVSSSFESSTNTIKYCTFESCGEEGYAVVSLDSITFSNNVIDAKNQNGGILVKNINAKISHCSFSNTFNSKAIYYDQLDTTLYTREFVINNCTFTHCLDCCLHFGILENTPDAIIISGSKFIECYATGEDYLQSNVISINEAADSFSFTVEGCQFKNCGKVGYIISFAMTQMISSYYEVPIRFSNSQFEFDTTESCCAIKIAQTYRKVEVHKCVFKRCSPNIRTEQFVSCIYAFKPIELIVEESTFVGCGSPSFGGTAIAVDETSLDSYNGCTVKNCTFNILEEDDVEYPYDGAVISYSEHLNLIGNNFIECNSFAIEIKFKSLESSTFRMIENTFEKCRSTLVATSDGSFTKTPEIKGNTFKEISISTQLFLFLINYYSSTIKFESNTFNKVSTSYGGFGGKINFDNSLNDTPLSLVFTNCNFIENSQNVNGGAFQSNDIQNKLEASLTFKSCNFISNKAKGLGGALYIDYNHGITIEECEFKGNKAGDGQGSAIYIANDKQRTSKVKISKCNFTDNDDFEDNKYDGFAIIASSHQIEITECNIEYSNEETAISGLKVESSNTFTMSKCALVRCGGSFDVSFVIYSQNPIVFTDNTIEYGKNIGAIILADEVTEQSIVSCSFNNNTYSSIGAATSILIKHENNEADNLKVKLNKCSFVNNIILSGSGGALYLDEDKVGLDINECTFSENHATDDGGALCIKRASSLHVENTKFLNNRCSKRGGAIYIDFVVSTEASKLSDENYCSISSSTFQKNIAGLNGNGIFVNDGRSDAKYAISNNNFVNNYKDMLLSGFVIVSKSIDLNVQTVNTFSNTNGNIKVYPYYNILKDQLPEEFNQPYKTPEPLELEKIEHKSNFVIDTSELKENIEYVVDLVYDVVKVIGEGSKNLYLKFSSDVEIDKTDAKFGVVLDSSLESQSIKVNQKEIELNVKGSGMLIIEKEPENDESNSLEINDVVVSHEENIILNVKNKLDTFQMSNLDMYGQSSFDIPNNQIKESPEVKSAMVHEGARAQINNIEVKEKLEIAVDAVINLIKVKLSNAKLVVNYSPDKQRSMPLSGLLGDPPKSISLKKSEREMVKDDDDKNQEARLLEDTKFYIASALPNEFTKCEDWAKKVNFDGSDYNKAICQIEDENMVLYAVAGGEPGGGDGENDGKKPVKNNLPIIIGAAAGGVVLICVIVVIVVVVVKKKNKSKEKASDKFKETLNSSFDIDLDL